jgi:YD repeat-containing protein
VRFVYDATERLDSKAVANNGEFLGFKRVEITYYALELNAVSGTGVDERYLYDPDGQRIKKTSNGVETFYPFAHYEVEVNGGTITETKYYFFGSQRVAMRKNGVLSYLHADHLGSTLLATDASGAVVDNNQPRYYAYGRERLPNVAGLPTDHSFNGFNSAAINRQNTPSPSLAQIAQPSYV